MGVLLRIGGAPPAAGNRNVAYGTVWGAGGRAGLGPGRCGATTWTLASAPHVKHDPPGCARRLPLLPVPFNLLTSSNGHALVGNGGRTWGEPGAAL
jgi:hypothetical protein